jgi:MFS superfamily sulfate permease-like transporter
VERGVIVGVVLALGVHLYRELTITTPSTRQGDTLIVAPEGVLWFATVPGVDRMIRSELAEHRDLRRVELDLAGVGRLDLTAAAALRRLLDELASVGVAIEIVNLRSGVSHGVASLLELD